MSVKSEMARPALVEGGVGRRYGGYAGRDGEAGAREGGVGERLSVRERGCEPSRGEGGPEQRRCCYDL